MVQKNSLCVGPGPSGAKLIQPKSLESGHRFKKLILKKTCLSNLLKHHAKKSSHYCDFLREHPLSDYNYQDLIWPPRSY